MRLYLTARKKQRPLALHRAVQGDVAAKKKK